MVGALYLPLFKYSNGVVDLNIGVFFIIFDIVLLIV
jgi:hypothetical protein